MIDHERVKNRIVTIMNKYYNLFPISSLIREHSERYDEESRVKIINYNISSLLGIDALIHYCSININRLRFIINLKDLENIEKYVIILVLSEYLPRFPNKEETDLWKLLKETENLEI